MSASRPARCLLAAGPPKSMKLTIPHRHAFHTSPNLAERKRPKTRSIKAEDMGLTRATPQFADVRKREGRSPMSLADGPLKDLTPKVLFKPYTPEDKEALAKRYTADQMRVIEAGEKAINRGDLKSHGTIRDDRYGLPYLDDLSRHNPLLDLKPRPQDNYLDGPMEFMTEDEQRDAMGDWLEKIQTGQIPTDEDVLPEQRPTELDFMNFIHDSDAFVKSKKPKPIQFSLGGKQEILDTISKGKPDNSVVNHALPPMKDESLFYPKPQNDGDEEGTYDQLKKQTKMSLQQIKAIKVKILVRHRVVNQTRLGKISSQYCLAIAGNGKGLLGIGEGKSTEGEDASKQARLSAIRNMKPIPMYEQRTIFGEVYGKVSAAEVNLYSRPPGFGLRVQHNIFEMARAAGIQDLSARVPRSRNPMNTVKATYQALMRQRIPDEIARGRGQKLVDVRKVYYAGRSPA